MTDEPTKGYRRQPAAETDLERIWNYTAETWSPVQADDYVRGLVRTFDLLVGFPGYGPRSIHRSDVTRTDPT